MDRYVIEKMLEELPFLVVIGYCPVMTVKWQPATEKRDFRQVTTLITRLKDSINFPPLSFTDIYLGVQLTQE